MYSGDVMLTITPHGLLALINASNKKMNVFDRLLYKALLLITQDKNEP